MELTSLRAFLLTLPGTQEDTPFGPEILVYRIAGKMFALVDWQAEPLTINLKCEPELALLLREIHRGQTRLAHEQAALEHGYPERHPGQQSLARLGAPLL